MTTSVLCLASASPRRRELLLQIGVPHRVCAASIDETAHPGELAEDYVLRMAWEKARAIARDPDASGGLAVLAADTSVVLDEHILGKPASREEGIEMLLRLASRTHRVLTGVALVAPGRERAAISESSVTFRRISREEAALYWATGEPRDKAGGYAVQGQGAVFVSTLQGSYSGVMGLPLFETAELLRGAGIAVWAPRGAAP